MNLTTKTKTFVLIFLATTFCVFAQNYKNPQEQTLVDLMDVMLEDFLNPQEMEEDYVQPVLPKTNPSVSTAEDFSFVETESPKIDFAEPDFAEPIFSQSQHIAVADTLPQTAEPAVTKNIIPNEIPLIEEFIPLVNGKSQMSAVKTSYPQSTSSATYAPAKNTSSHSVPTRTNQGHYNSATNEIELIEEYITLEQARKMTTQTQNSSNMSQNNEKTFF